MTLLSNVIFTGFAVLLVIVKECVESDDKIIEVYDHLSGKTWDWYNSNTVDYDGIPSKATTPGRHAWITFKTTNGKTFTTFIDFTAGFLLDYPEAACIISCIRYSGVK